MLLETFTKKKPNDEMFTGDLDLKSWVHSSLPDKLDEIIDADLLTVDEQKLNEKLQYVSSIMELAMNCTANIPMEIKDEHDWCCSSIEKDQTGAFFLLPNDLMTSTAGTFCMYHITISSSCSSILEYRNGRDPEEIIC